MICAVSVKIQYGLLVELDPSERSELSAYKEFEDMLIKLGGMTVLWLIVVDMESKLVVRQPYT
jgi:hypothetical protein